MARQLTDQERRNIQVRVEQLLEGQTEKELEAASGIPQSTINHIRGRAKVGYQIARRLADYLGENVEDLLRGQGPSGYYAALETMHPSRGKVLDRLRGIVAKEVLDEVAAIRLPEGSPEWDELEWLEEVLTRARRRKRLGKKPT